MDGHGVERIGFTGLEQRYVLAQVLTDAEAPTCPGEDHGAHGVVSGDVLDRRAQRLFQRH